MSKELDNYRKALALTGVKKPFFWRKNSPTKYTFIVDFETSDEYYLMVIVENGRVLGSGNIFMELFNCIGWEHQEPKG